MNSLYYFLAHSLCLNVNFSALISMGLTSELPTPVKHHSGLSPAPSGSLDILHKIQQCNNQTFWQFLQTSWRLYPSLALHSHLQEQSLRSHEHWSQDVIPHNNTDTDSNRKWRVFFSCSSSVHKTSLASVAHTKAAQKFLHFCRLIKLNQAYPLMKKLAFYSFLSCASLRSGFSAVS